MANFSGTTTSTYTLTANPTTVTSAGLIDVNSTTAYIAGILGSNGFPWTLTNLGTVESIGSRGIGIYLQFGGVVTNGSTGAIAGEYAGIKVSGGIGTISNLGTVSASGTADSFGISLISGGNVTNGAGGSITASRAGILIYSGFGTVSNLGTVSASDTSVGVGVLLQGFGGDVTNGSGGSIASGSYGVLIAGGIGLVSNLGTVSAGGIGIDLRSGGSITNAAGASIVSVRDAVSGSGGATTVTNSGLIQNSGATAAIYLRDGGAMTNAATGTIAAPRTAISFNNTSGTAVSVGNVVNDGTVESTGVTAGVGVYFGQGGALTNELGGVITAYRSAVSVAGSAGTIANFGTIAHTGTGTSGQAVYLGAGGSVGNYGLISGARPGTAGAYGGVVNIHNQPGTVANLGTIETSNLANGIVLTAGGAVFNGATSNTASTIAAPHNSIYIGGSGGVPTPGALGTVVNFGSIESTGNARGVALASGGLVVNYRYILGVTTGISFLNTVAGTVDNFGTVISTSPNTATSGAGAYLAAGGLITNETGGTIAAQYHAGVSLTFFGTTSAAGAVVNDGLVTGAIGVSIGAGDTGNNTIDNFGTIVGTGTGGLAIRLGSGDDSVVIEAGSQLQGAVGNFHPGDTFDLPSLTFDANDSVTLVSNGTVTNQLQIDGTAGTLFTIALDPNQDFSADRFQLSADAGTGTLVTEQPVCFCRGTRILTERGEMAVEELKIGDRVETLSGALKPITWIGFGRDLITRANRLARPVIVRRGALADDLPRRDLYLTHGHALYLDGVLIPVEHLVNHRSIRWDESARIVEYYHIELDNHDVVFADGAPAESYHDADNRALFQNARASSEATAATPTFAPVLTSGDTVGRVWARLFERAGGRIDPDTSDDPDLHLVVDGARLDPAMIGEGVCTFALTAPPAGTLHLCSRSGVPSLLGLGRHDHRLLGVAIRQLILQQPGVMTCIDHDAPVLRAGGCHRPEAGHSWTDGDLHLPARLFAHLKGPFRMVVHTRQQAMRYARAPAAAAGEPQRTQSGLRVATGREC